MKLAFDTHVSRDAITEAERNGHEVVYWASDEPDNVWFREAVDLGAEVFVSADWDISILAGNNDKGFIKLPQRLGKERLVKYIMMRLGVAMKAHRTEGRYPEILK